MKWIKFTYKAFMSEPLWFKILIISTLLISIIFSSSSFNGYLQSIAKLATAIFFGTYGFKLRRSRMVSIIFFALAVGSLYLSWSIFNQAISE